MKCLNSTHEIYLVSEREICFLTYLAIYWRGEQVLLNNSLAVRLIVKAGAVLTQMLQRAATSAGHANYSVIPGECDFIFDKREHLVIERAG